MAGGAEEAVDTSNSRHQWCIDFCASETGDLVENQINFTYEDSGVLCPEYHPAYPSDLHEEKRDGILFDRASYSERRSAKL